MKKRIVIVCVVVLAAAAVLSIASRARTTATEGAPPPPEVGVARVEQRDLPLNREWIGTLDGLVNAAIKAEVNGYLLKQNYVEGSFVRKGQLLFEIDPRPFQAAVDQAEGQVAQAKAQFAQARAAYAQAQAQVTSAEANQKKAQLDEDRYVPLAQQQAITQQDMDNAHQANASMKAQVTAARAQADTAKAQIEAASAGITAATAGLQTAQVNLGFTRLTSPIDGIAGAATTQVGNLVGPSSAPVTAVSTLDPIKANFSVSEQEYLELTRNDALHRLELDLVLADGSIHPHKGRFSFADRQVNSNTGSIQLTGLFPNPGNALRPGQYAKVRASIGIQKDALLVPQRSVTDTQGHYLVAVVEPNNTIRFANVEVGRQVDSKWVIEKGLKPGERVVTDGLFKIRPGAPVTPKGAN